MVAFGLTCTFPGETVETVPRREELLLDRGVQKRHTQSQGERSKIKQPPIRQTQVEDLRDGAVDAVARRHLDNPLALVEVMARRRDRGGGYTRLSDGTQSSHPSSWDSEIGCGVNKDE